MACHPKLAAGLSDVRLSVSMGEDVVGCQSSPKGEWDREKRTLVWKVAHLPSGGPPTLFKADFATGGAPAAGRAGKPLLVHFVSDACNLTAMRPRAPPGGPVGKVLSRFVSGKYIVNPA